MALWNSQNSTGLIPNVVVRRRVFDFQRQQEAENGRRINPSPSKSTPIVGNEGWWDDLSLCLLGDIIEGFLGRD
ncbi:unnamed protein product [Dovyalis caffra]|uniref:Uncharacterized protein n=1 Tax=Dovyalis caffra TaxID=77055 RepID=A0AAV1SDJ0_9ROSI|nr:unnamed protein product [Dovyalis caffra]